MREGDIGLKFPIGFPIGLLASIMFPFFSKGFSVSPFLIFPLLEWTTISVGPFGSTWYALIVPWLLKSENAYYLSSSNSGFMSF